MSALELIGVLTLMVSRTDTSVLEEQRLLIQTLIEEKKVNERHFESLSKTPEATKIDHCAPLVTPVMPADPLSAELQAYCSMIQNVISQIDDCQTSLDQAQHTRIREGIWKIHQDELIQCFTTHGGEAAKLVQERLGNSLPVPATAYAMPVANHISLP